jgi:MFS family permease
MGYVGLAMSVGIMLAPLLGGIVYDTAGYTAVFAMCFGILGFDIALRLLMVEVSVARRWIPIDVEIEEATQEKPSTAGIEAETPPRAAVVSPSSSTATDLESAGLPPKKISLDPDVISGVRMKSRLPPIFALLASPRLLVGLWCTLVQATLLTAFDSTLPLRVRNIFGWSSLGAGLIFLPLVLPSFVGPLIGKLSDARGPKVPTAAGFVLAIPFLVLLRLVDYDSIKQKVLLCALLLFYGLSTTMCLMPLMAEISLVVEAKEAAKPKGYYGKQGAYAQAYGLFNMVCHECIGY